MKDFFISYTGVDRDRADWVAHSLERGGFTTVYQREDFPPGGNIILAINDALQNSRCTIVLLSPDYFLSPFTGLEWSTALYFDPTLKEGRIWPIMIRSCQPPGLLATIAYTPLANLDDERASQILLNDATRVKQGGRPVGPGHPLPEFPKWLYSEVEYRDILRKRLEDRLSTEIEAGKTGATVRLLEPYIEGSVPETSFIPVKRNRTTLEAYRLYKWIVILGEAGSGKSTFLRHLALDLARGVSARIPPPLSESSRLPVFLSLGNFSRWLQERPRKSEDSPRETGDLLDYILNVHAKEFFGVDSSEVIATALRMGRAAVLLDGLDEIPDDSWKLVLAAIQGLRIRVNDGNRYVITCRTLNYRQNSKLPTGWLELELEPLSAQQIEEYVDLWERDLLRIRPEPTPSLKNRKDWPQILSLAKNPLLLSLLAGSHYRATDTALSSFQLFENAIEELLWGREDNKRNEAGSTPRLPALFTQAGVNPASLRPCLDAIAFQGLLDRNQTAGVVSKQMVISTFKTLHPEKSEPWSHQLLELLELRTGLFLPSRNDKKEVRYNHISFQDVMAGAHLARQLNFTRAVTLLLRRNQRLRGAVLYATSNLIQRQGDFETPVFLAHVLSIQSVERDDPWDLVMAGDILIDLGLRNTRKVPTGEQVRKSVAQRLARLLESGALSPKDRNRAGNTLAQLGDPRFDPNCLYLPISESGTPEGQLGFAHIAEGPFSMGSELQDFPEENGNSRPIEIPYYFWIARYPVTCSQFAAFIAQHGYEHNEWWKGLGWAWRTSDPEAPASLPPARDRSIPWKWSEQQAFKNRPITGVCWFEARAYTSWLDHSLRLLGKVPEGYEIRLPTEAEWEKASRSGNDLADRYPWGGAEWDHSKGNFSNSTINHPTPVGMFPCGASPLGIYDLAGNVLEWTISQNERYPYSSRDGRNEFDMVKENETRTVRGGSFRGRFIEGRSAARFIEQPGFAQENLGFRIVLSVQSNFV